MRFTRAFKLSYVSDVIHNGQTKSTVAGLHAGQYRYPRPLYFLPEPDRPLFAASDLIEAQKESWNMETRRGARQLTHR